MKAYSYLRFSTAKQMHGDSFRRQEQMALDYCGRNGLTLDTSVTYRDLGVSAFRGKNSETGRLGEFLDAVEAGLIARGSYLLVESLDRISRQAARKALRLLEAICDESITVVTLCDGRVYTREVLDADPMALIMSVLIFIRAHEESQMKSKRISAAWSDKRERAVSVGHKLTSIGPGWLYLAKTTQRWMVIDERAKVVRRIFTDAARGISPQEIVDALNKEGVPTFGGSKRWGMGYVMRILFHYPAVVGTCVPRELDHVDGNGKRIWRDLDPIEGYFPPVVDAELYRRVQAFRGWCPPGRARQSNVFAGMVVCGRCGGSMTLQKKGAHRYFVCISARYGRGCKYTAVRYENVEAAFIQSAPSFLGDGGSGSERSASISNHAKELRRLLKAGARGSIDRTAIHAGTRAMFGGLSLNPDTGVATLGWRHGGASQFQFC